MRRQPILGCLGDIAILSGNSPGGLVSASAAATTVSATAAASATTATASAATALFAWTGFIDGQRTAVDLFQVQAVDRRAGLIGVVELDEAKPLAAARIAVH